MHINLKRVFRPLPVLALALQLAFCTASGQDSYGLAAYVNANGDSVNGFIQYGPNANGFFFKTAMKEQAVFVKVSDAASYRYKGGKSFKAVIYLDEDSKENLAFAEMVVEGYMSLYKLGGRYIIGTDKKVLLSKGQMKDETEATSSFVRNAGLFNFVLKECTSRTLYVPGKTVFNQTTVTGITKDFNECLGKEYQQYDRRNRKVTEIAVFAGSTSSTLTLGEPGYLDGTKLPKSTEYSFGLMVHRYLPGSPVGFQVETSFTSSAGSAVLVYTNEVAGYLIEVTNDMDYDIKLLNFKVGARLSHRSNTLNLYTAGGFNFGAALELPSMRIETTTINSVVSGVEEFPLLGSSTAGLWVSGGMKWNVRKAGVFADFQYEKAFLSDGASFDILTPRLGLLFRL